MTQHPRASFMEAATQAAVGVPIGFAVTFAIGLMGMSAASAALITLSMFVASTARGYVIRRRFDRERSP
jgi:hypothetical protein